MKNGLNFIGFILCGCLLLSGCSKRKTQETEFVTVRTEKPAEQVFHDVISTQGVIEPLDHAQLSARIAGTLEELKVKEGDRVKAGDVLFRQDRQTLENRVILTQETLKMAKERLNTRQLDERLAELSMKKAEIDYHRNQKLREKEIVTQSNFESIELNWNSTRLSYDKARAARQTAQAEVNFAEAAWKISLKQLEDSIVRAPYDCIIVSKLKETHEFCGAGTPILKIEKPGRKRVVVLLSGLYQEKIISGKTPVLISFGTNKLRVPVSYTADTIDPVSRTFEVKADFPPESLFASGSLCEVSFILGERCSLSVPEEAVLSRKNGQSVVYAYDNGKALEIPVRSGVSRNGRTEILNGADVAGKNVIVSGQYFISSGTPVRLFQ